MRRPLGTREHILAGAVEDKRVSSHAYRRGASRPYFKRGGAEHSRRANTTRVPCCLHERALGIVLTVVASLRERNPFVSESKAHQAHVCWVERHIRARGIGLSVRRVGGDGNRKCLPDLWRDTGGGKNHRSREGRD